MQHYNHKTLQPTLQPLHHQPTILNLRRSNKQWMYMAKTDNDDPYRLGPPQSVNDKRRIGQGKISIFDLNLNPDLGTESGYTNH